MKKQTLVLICIFSATIGILVGLVIYRRYHPSISAPPKGAHPATEANRDYVKTEAEWLAKRFVPFPITSFVSHLSGLRIDDYRQQRTDINKQILFQTIDRVLQSLKADTFDQFVQLRTSGAQYQFDQIEMNSRRALLKELFLKDGEKIPEDDLAVLKAYWNKVTKQGQLQSYWAAICWDESWIRVDALTEVSLLYDNKAFNSFVIDNFQNCGNVSDRSVFQYKPRPQDIISTYGQVCASLCYLLIKNSDGKAYPLIIQMYWAPDIAAWLPAHYGIGYVGPRKLDPVF